MSARHLHGFIYSSTQKNIAHSKKEKKTWKTKITIRNVIKKNRKLLQNQDYVCVIFYSITALFSIYCNSGVFEMYNRICRDY